MCDIADSVLDNHLAREILRITNQVQKRRQKGNYKLIIRWTARHEGITGNKEVDHKAKKAAEGKTSDKKLLPSYLRKLLLINPAARKRAHHKGLMKIWKKDWKTSAQGKRAACLDRSTPSKKFLKAISQKELSCIDASQIAQFRIGTTPVNQYLR